MAKKALIMRVVILTLLIMHSNAHADSVWCKPVGKDWVWFGDHVVGSIRYAVAFPTGEKVEVGTGVMLFGKPRGSIYKTSEAIDINAYGIGAIHIRTENDDRINVCIDSNGATAITIIDEYF